MFTETFYCIFANLRYRYAKVCNGYLALISGSATEALTLLTGSPTVTHNINCSDEDIPAVWASLERACANGSLMVISTVRGDRPFQPNCIQVERDWCSASVVPALPALTLGFVLVS